MEENILQLKNITYGYENRQKILDEASYEFKKGILYAIVGPSGSGKTTTLSLAGALDVPKSGTIEYKGTNIKKIGYTKYRRKNISFIFQSYNLINYMNAIENVILGMDISKSYKKNKKEIATQILEDVGLTKEEMTRNIRKLSGGQQQRVAIARELASEAEVVLADEPTGNLDKNITQEIITMFQKLAKEKNKCVIIVTHSNQVSEKADKVLELCDGKLCKIA